MDCDIFKIKIDILSKQNAENLNLKNIKFCLIIIKYREVLFHYNIVKFKDTLGKSLTTLEELLPVYLESLRLMWKS